MTMCSTTSPYLADQHGDLGARLYWEAMPRTSSGFGIEKNNGILRAVRCVRSDGAVDSPRSCIQCRAAGRNGLSQAHPLRPAAKGGHSPLRQPDIWLKS